MKGRIIIAAAVLLAAGGAAASPVRPGQFYDWTGARRTPLVLSAGGMTVTVTRQGDGDDLVGPRVRVTVPGQRPVTIVGHSGSSRFVATIGLGKLRASDSLPSVVLETFTGGAHCCNHVEVVAPTRRGLRRVSLGMHNGGPADAFPTDITGDGVVDFRFGDDNFLYAFSSYAGSFAPAKVLSVIDGRVRDVSHAPGLRALRATELAAARTACVTPEPDREVNGACAGYAGVAALLGRFDAVWPATAVHYDRAATGFPTGCRVTPEPRSGCPKEATITYPDFPTALRAFLVRLRYLPGAAAPPPVP